MKFSFFKRQDSTQNQATAGIQRVKTPPAELMKPPPDPLRDKGQRMWERKPEKEKPAPNISSTSIMIFKEVFTRAFFTLNYEITYIEERDGLQMLNEKDEENRRKTLHGCFARFAKQLLTCIHDTVGGKAYGEMVDECKTHRVHIDEIDGEEKVEEEPWEETLPNENEEIKEQIELEDKEGDETEEEAE